MRKSKPWLASILALQILFSAGLYWRHAHTAQGESTQILFNFEQKKISRVVISDGNSTATLNKLDQKWVLSDLQQLPVNKNKLTDFLDKLTQLKTGWPVATTKDSHIRFEVANDKFRRHVQLYRDNDLIGEFFVGSSPSFRKGHFRHANDNTIYTVALGSYELPVDNMQWLDTALLSAKDVTVIKGADFSLRKSTNKWHFDLTEENVDTSNRTLEIDEEKVSKLVSALTSLRILGLAKTNAPFTNESPFKILDVTGTSNWRYELLEQDEKYYVRRNDIDTLFTLRKSDYELLTNMELVHLSKQNKAENPELSTAKSSANPIQVKAIARN